MMPDASTRLPPRRRSSTGSSTRKRELLTFEGGKPPESGPCDPLAPHGYCRIAAQVVGAIAQWIKAAP